MLRPSVAVGCTDYKFEHSVKKTGRKIQIVHLLLSAEKETETHSAVVKSNLVTDRPAKLRVKAPKKSKLRFAFAEHGDGRVYKKVE